VFAAQPQGRERSEIGRLPPASTSSSAPTRPMNFAARPSVAASQSKKSRLPVCTVPHRCQRLRWRGRFISPDLSAAAPAPTGRESSPLPIAFSNFVSIFFPHSLTSDRLRNGNEAFVTIASVRPPSIVHIFTGGERGIVREQSCVDDFYGPPQSCRRVQPLRNS